MIFDLIILFGIHFITDFPFQTREMGRKKSENITWWSGHVIIIFICFTATGLWIFDSHPFPIEPAIILSLGIAFIHGIQDWIIWNIYKISVKVRIIDDNSKKESSVNAKMELRDWKYWEDHWFYTTIGLDQTLHFITILLIYNWVK